MVCILSSYLGLHSQLLVKIMSAGTYFAASTYENFNLAQNAMLYMERKSLIQSDYPYHNNLLLKAIIHGLHIISLRPTMTTLYTNIVC